MVQNFAYIFVEVVGTSCCNCFFFSEKNVINFFFNSNSTEVYWILKKNILKMEAFKNIKIWFKDLWYKIKKCFIIKQGTKPGTQSSFKHELQTVSLIESSTDELVTLFHLVWSAYKCLAFNSKIFYCRSEFCCRSLPPGCSRGPCVVHHHSPKGQNDFKL